jgi:arylsulfatase A-like enzyme
VAPTVLALPAASVTFEVAVREPGARTVVDSLKITAGETPAWHDRRVDLARWEGRDVEIELRTTTSFQGDPPAALWASPALIGRGPPPIPYSVLWIVIDAMRPDVLAAWHDDARDKAIFDAEVPPLDAWLRAMPTVAPNIDGLARRGVAFVDASSAATWTRPGTMALLSGARSSELGLDTTPWILPGATIARFYALDPPLLPLLVRKEGVRAAGFVNNFFLTGYARAGIDPGLPEMVDHRDESLDTDRIVKDALRFLDERRDERFFAFVNLNSPHNPYEPEPRFLKQVPKRPLGPTEPAIRAYLGEIAKDDAAVGRLVAKLDALGLRERTLVVVTADHGETLSAEHDVKVQGLGEGGGSTRFRHANAMWDETVRVPIVMSLPGRLPEGARVTSPVSTLDIAPTIVDLLGIPRPRTMHGTSLVAAASGGTLDAMRPIVSEGRGTRSVRVGPLRYVERDPNADHLTSPTTGLRVAREELFDLSRDPGERRDVSRERPDDLAKMREHLALALATSTANDARASAALAGSRQLPAEAGPAGRVRLRFVGAGAARRVTFTARIDGGELGKLVATPVDLDPASVRVVDGGVDVALTTATDGVLGIDLSVVPASARIRWEIRFDDELVQPSRVHAGRFGLAFPRLAAGMLDPETAVAATTRDLPAIDPRRDLGVFIVRDPGADTASAVDESGEAASEMKQLLESWGYAKTK